MSSFIQMRAKELNQMLEHAQALCANRGVRLTAGRREVLSIIYQAGQPIGAYEILERMREAHDKIAPTTVYRALDFLLQEHLIHKLETLHAFVPCDSPDHPHSSKFLICTECGDVDELDSSGVDRNLSKLAQAKGFMPKEQTVEISGTCADCIED
ncbi:MAG: transcriptional repressor, partial [Salinisphaeraceae bacterium]|nr:transcriptional repressor [Salinisphaeraceae bacterium]